MKRSSVRFTDLQIAVARDPKWEIESAFVAAGLPMRPTTCIDETSDTFWQRVLDACRSVGVILVIDRVPAARITRYRFVIR